jgi:hypothetical protein
MIVTFPLGVCRAFSRRGGHDSRFTGDFEEDFHFGDCDMIVPR